MTDRTPRRGRPKGTGIDDSELLAAMAKQMMADPGLRPTTAIKALGISNQSTIRRLRDKYKRACNSGAIHEIVSRVAGPDVSAPKRLKISNAKRNPPRRLPSRVPPPANDDLRCASNPSARLHHYATALHNSVIAVQHRLDAETPPADDEQLRELLDQQYHLSSVIIGLISETEPSPFLSH